PVRFHIRLLLGWVSEPCLPGPQCITKGPRSLTISHYSRRFAFRVLLPKRVGFRHEARFGGEIDHWLGGSDGSARIRSVSIRPIRHLWSIHSIASPLPYPGFRCVLFSSIRLLVAGLVLTKRA